MGRKTGKKVVIDGVEYSSIGEAARSRQMNASTVTQRIRAGYTIEEALNPDFKGKPRRRGVSKKIEGYKSLKELCRDQNLERKYEQIKARINKGERLENILSSLKSRKEAAPITVYGKTYKSIAEFCRQNDCVKHGPIMRTRIRNGETPEEAYEHIKLRQEAQREREIG